MVVKERNTKEFRDIINTIIVNRQHEIIFRRGKKIHYNFNLNGETKPIAINKKSTDNVMSYYWCDDESMDCVTFEEYKQFKRNLKISLIDDEKVEIIPTKISFEKKNQFDVKIGDVIGCKVSYGHSCFLTNVIITKVTAQQFKYKLFSLRTIPEEEYTFGGEDRINEKGQEFWFAYRAEYTTRNSQGEWITEESNSYWIYRNQLIPNVEYTARNLTGFDYKDHKVVPQWKNKDITFRKEIYSKVEIKEEQRQALIISREM